MIEFDGESRHLRELDGVTCQTLFVYSGKGTGKSVQIKRLIGNADHPKPVVLLAGPISNLAAPTFAVAAAAAAGLSNDDGVSLLNAGLSNDDGASLLNASLSKHGLKHTIIWSETRAKTRPAKVLIISPQISVASVYAKPSEYDAANYHLFRGDSASLFQHDRVIISLESLHKILDCSFPKWVPDIVILDESEWIMQTFSGEP